jgi:ParB/RepB/Spo0J family partition protein
MPPDARSTRPTPAWATTPETDRLTGSLGQGAACPVVSQPCATMAVGGPAVPPTVITEIALDQLVVDRANPRHDATADDDMVASVADNGLIEPMVVRVDPDDPGRYGVVCGSRRLDACVKAGLDPAPCIVRDDLDDAAALAIGMQENVHRADMNPIEQAIAYETLIEEHGWSLERVAREVNVSAATVRNRLVLLELPPGVQDRVAAGTMTIKGALKAAKTLGRTEHRALRPRKVDLNAVDDTDPDEVEAVGQIVAGTVEVAVPAPVWRAVTTAAAMAGQTPGAWMVGAIRDRVLKQKAHHPQPDSGGRAGPAMVKTRIPSGPLVDVIEARGGIGALTGHLDQTARDAIRRAYHRAKTSGDVTEAMADELCVKLLGKAPTEVWGSEWGRKSA